MNVLRRVLPCLLTCVLVISGCSSLPRNPFSSANPAEVAGTYQIRQLQFSPEASALSDINVLDHLNRDASSLELTSSRDFVLRYRPDGGRQVTLTGTYSLSSDKVELNGQREDADLYGDILLNRTFYLHRQKPNVLWVHLQKAADPEQLSPSYEGLTDVKGTLRMKFVRADS